MDVEERSDLGGKELLINFFRQPLFCLKGSLSLPRYAFVVNGYWFLMYGKTTSSKSCRGTSTRGSQKNFSLQSIAEKGSKKSFEWFLSCSGILFRPPHIQSLLVDLFHQGLWKRLERKIKKKCFQSHHDNAVSRLSIRGLRYSLFELNYAWVLHTRSTLLVMFQKFINFS